MCHVYVMTVTPAPFNNLILLSKTGVGTVYGLNTPAGVALIVADWSDSLSCAAAVTLIPNVRIAEDGTWLAPDPMSNHWLPIKDQRPGEGSA